MPAVPTILVAADAQFVRDDVISALAGEYDIIVVEGGREVRKAVTEHNVHIAVLDMQMGSMGGIAATMDLRLEESGGEVLVVPVEVEDDRMPLRQPRERLEEPRRQRIRVHRERHRGAAPRIRVRPELGECVVLQERCLPGQAHHREPRRRRTGGLGAHEQDAPQLLLQRLDPLTHGRRRDVEATGGGIERALVDHGGDGLGQLERNPHRESG